MKMSPTSAFVVVSWGVLLFLHETTQKCCAAPSGICNDLTKGSPCCSYGACNLFCCACADGCRRFGRHRPKRESRISMEDSADGFKVIDADHDGFVSFEETKAHIRSGRCGNTTIAESDIAKYFSRRDVDRSGFLSEAEINIA